MVDSSNGGSRVGHGHNGALADARGNVGEAYWLELWAYGTSPYGLGLTEAAFWGLGFREFDALRKQHRKHLERWALEQAMTANIWRKPDTPPFAPSDFLDAGARDRNVAEFAQREADIAAANAALARITAGAEPGPTIPDWAIGDYQGKVN